MKRFIFLTLATFLVAGTAHAADYAWAPYHNRFAADMPSEQIAISNISSDAFELQFPYILRQILTWFKGLLAINVVFPKLVP